MTSDADRERMDISAPDGSRDDKGQDRTSDAESARASEDELLFRRYSAELAEAVESQLDRWVIRSVQQRASDDGVDFDEDLRHAALEAGTRCRSEIGPQMRRLLSSDVDDQRSTPLTIIRSATSYATGVLTGAGVAPVERDEFDRRAFPDDVYGLAPASMADVDASLVEPWIVWGAAKAHIHRRRHRDQV